MFAKADCSHCQSLSQCTKAKSKRRTINIKPQELHEALQQTRKREKTEEFKEEYKQRSGIEGTISQGVRAFGMRRSRYIGKAKTHLQHLATGAAINLERVADWFAGVDREKTRTSAFARDDAIGSAVISSALSGFGIRQQYRRCRLDTLVLVGVQEEIHEVVVTYM